MVWWVVSTVAPGILFARFPTVECINKGCSFLLWRISCTKEVRVEKESELSSGRAITFLALCHQIHIHCQQHNNPQKS